MRCPGKAPGKSWGAALLLLAGCVPLPVQLAPGLAGRVVDAESGLPLADAVVVVRFEGSYDDVLPDIEVLGHREARSDAEGRFRTPALQAAGFMPWPWMRVRSRVVTAYREGYRCAGEQAVPLSAALRVPLEASDDEDQRRLSCRPVPAPASQIPLYAGAWSALYPPAAPQRPSLPESPAPALARLLDARAEFGFGANCQGPALDLALAPDGDRLGVLIEAEAALEVQVLELAGISKVPVEVALREPLGRTSRLSWSDPTRLALHQTGPLGGEPGAADPLAMEEDPLRVVWTRGPLPPAAAAPLRIQDPADRNDEAATRYAGRAFLRLAEVDAETGMPRDRLRVSHPDGRRWSIDLPGEACRGDFGEPQHRLARDGVTGIDLRFVQGGCRAVAIDLSSGDWLRLDAPAPGSADRGRCASQRRVPLSQLELALRGYTADLRRTIRAASLDPSAAFTLHVAAGGETVIETIDVDGGRVTLPAPHFPLTTPLERIEISVVAPPPTGLPPGRLPSKPDPSAGPASPAEPPTVDTGPQPAMRPL